jgi:hypothetical protein
MASSDSRLRTAGAALVGALCAYEVIALTAGTPTISRISWKLREHKLGMVFIWGALGALAWHLLIDGD